MEQGIADFVGRMQTPIAKLGVKELREREATWRALWSWIPDNVKYLVYRIGSEVRILRRDYKGSVGELGGITFEATQYEVTVYAKQYNENDGRFYFENKTILIPQGTVMMLEFIADREPVEEEQPEVMGLEDEGLEQPSGVA